MKQISESEARGTGKSARAGFDDRSASLKLTSLEGERCGLMAAETAAVVPSLRALRRVILPVMNEAYSSESNLPTIILWRVQGHWLPAMGHSRGHGRNRVRRHPCRQISRRSF